MRLSIAFPTAILLGMGGGFAFYHLFQWIQANNIQDWQFMLVLTAIAAAFGLWLDRRMRRV